MGAIARALLTATLVATVNASFQTVDTFEQLEKAFSNPANPIEIEVSRNIIWGSVLTVSPGDNVIIRGSNDQDRFTLDAQKSSSFFQIENGGTLNISNLVLLNGFARSRVQVGLAAGVFRDLLLCLALHLLAIRFGSLHCLLTNTTNIAP